jgi:hypothetical protein
MGSPQDKLKKRLGTVGRSLERIDNATVVTSTIIAPEQRGGA